MSFITTSDLILFESLTQHNIRMKEITHFRFWYKENIHQLKLMYRKYLNIMKKRGNEFNRLNERDFCRDMFLDSNHRRNISNRSTL